MKLLIFVHAKIYLPNALKVYYFVVFFFFFFFFFFVVMAFSYHLTINAKCYNLYEFVFVVFQVIFEPKMSLIEEYFSKIGYILGKIYFQKFMTFCFEITFSDHMTPKANVINF